MNLSWVAKFSTGDNLYRLLLYIHRTGENLESPCQVTWFQGCNAMKVNSEVYTSFVLQCTVSGR